MKILVIGADYHKRTAFGLRTRHFLQSLVQHEICLINIENNPQKNDKLPNGKCITTNKEAKEAQKIARDFQPEILLSINTYPSYIAARLNLNIPFWADLNGWIMAERQAQASSLNTNAFLPHARQIETTILRQADKISTVSTPQSHAVLGELAFLGRLNKENFKHQFTEVVRNAVVPEKIKKQKHEHFNILQIGGFNAWFDEKTLFEALEIVMAQNEKIRFITTGGILKGIDEKAYPRFQKRIAKSKYKNRFQLLGWVEDKQIPELYAQSDCLINVDFDCPETSTGARNRLTEGLRYQVPIITTLGSEIAQEITSAKAGLGTENGNVQGLSEAILQLSQDAKLQTELSQNGQKLLTTKYAPKSTLKPLQNWLKSPHKAHRGTAMKMNYWRAGLTYLQKNGFQAFFRKIWQKIK